MRAIVLEFGRCGWSREARGVNLGHVRVLFFPETISGALRSYADALKAARAQLVDLDRRSQGAGGFGDLD